MTSSRKNENLIWNIQTELTNTGTLIIFVKYPYIPFFILVTVMTEMTILETCGYYKDTSKDI